jgi:hypothetical protein
VNNRRAIALVLLSACAPKGGAVGSLGEEKSYRFDVEGVFTHSVLEGTLPAAFTEAHSDSRRLHLVAAPVRVHDDSSITTRISLSDGGDLQGVVVAMRHFETGEVLALDWLERAAGPGRGLDVYGLLFPVLSSKVPQVTPRRPSRLSTSWPMQVGEGRKLRERVDATWTWEGRELRQDEMALHLHYEGTWRTDGEDGGHRPAVVVSGRGTVAGDVWLNLDDLTVVAHDFAWSRSLDFTLPAAKEGPLVLRQFQKFEGRLVRDDSPSPYSPPLQGSPSLSPYLSRAEVVAALETALPAASACIPSDTAAGAAALTVSVGPQGLVTLSELNAAPGDPACWRTALESVVARPHAGGALRASSSFVHSEGNVHSSVDVRLHHRTPDPLFLHLPTGVSPAEQADIRVALGLDPAPEEPRARPDW